MRRNLLRALDALTVAGLAAAAVVFVSGGFDLALAGLVLSVRGVANPIAIALAAAGLRRLVGPPRGGDALVRLAARLGRWLAAGFGPGGERLRGWIAFRADALVFALLALWTFDRAIVERVEVEGDGVGYYAYVRSALLDHDLDFLNEYRDHDPRQLWVDRRTPTGRTDNPFAIGPALFWTPGFALGWLAAEVAAATGTDVELHGYSAPFVFASAATTWLLGIAGLALLYRLLLVHHRRRTALLATLGTALASPLGYYLALSPFYSHVHSFFAVTLFLWLCLRTPGDAPLGRWVLVGLAGGLVALTRWQDAVFWAVPALRLLGWWLADRREGGGRPGGRRPGGGRLRPVAARLGVLVATLALAVAPQLLVLQHLYGTWLGVPQGKAFMDVFPYWLWPTLVSWFHGLYSWTPLMLVATVGLVWAAWARRPWAGTFLAALALQLYANGAIAQWWAGAAFGARRFSSSVPLFALGLAELGRRAETRPGWRRLLVAVVAVAVVWNLVLAREFLTGVIPALEPLDPRVALATAWRWLVDLDPRPLTGAGTMLTALIDRVKDAVRDRWLLLGSCLAFYLLSRYRSERAEALTSSGPPSPPGGE